MNITIKNKMNYLSAIIALFLIFLPIKAKHIKEETKQINILLSLPSNDTYKFSRSNVLASLELAINEFNASKFKVEIIPGECDCSAVTATQNAMENVYMFRYKKENQNIQAIFGPMCD